MDGSLIQRMDQDGVVLLGDDDRGEGLLHLSRLRGRERTVRAMSVVILTRFA
jgi:hypothetical protein